MSIYLIVFLIIYIIFCEYIAIKFYNRYKWYFKPLIREDGTDYHNDYPEFSRFDGHLFTKKRLMIGMPFAIVRFIYLLLLVFIFFITIK